MPFFNVTVVMALYRGSRDLSTSQWWPNRFPVSDATQAFSCTQFAQERMHCWRVGVQLVDQFQQEASIPRSFNPSPPLSFRRRSQTCCQATRLFAPLFYEGPSQRIVVSCQFDQSLRVELQGQPWGKQAGSLKLS